MPFFAQLKGFHRPRFVPRVRRLVSCCAAARGRDSEPYSKPVRREDAFADEASDNRTRPSQDDETVAHSRDPTDCEQQIVALEAYSDPTQAPDSQAAEPNRIASDTNDSAEEQCIGQHSLASARLESPKISGPAGETFASYEDAAEHYIQAWLPEWRTRHYMLPSIFEYKFTEPSGRASGAVRGVGPDCEDRSMDVVFHAVNKFMTDHEIPGVVFNSFTMYRRGELLERFLPFMTGPDWVDQYADIECDLLIVSPSMGFVAFEVKGTQSTTLSVVRKALEQAAVGQASAKLIRPLLDVILQHVGVDTSDFPVRRVVALPFQKRERLVESKLGQAFRQLLADIEAGSDVDACLFSEDFSCPGATNDGLYSCLKQFLIPQVDRQTFVQEGASAKLMQTLIAIWALRMTGSDCRLDHSVASEEHAIDKTDEKINAQKLWVGKEKTRNKKSTNAQDPKTEGPKTAIIPCAPDSVMMTDPVNRIFFITPEQQKVLDGPRIQLIHGPAGSGKSVLIMIKAAQLIKDGGRVIILAQMEMVNKYKLWKKRNRFTDGQCDVYDTRQIRYYLQSLEHGTKFQRAIVALAKKTGIRLNSSERFRSHYEQTNEAINKLDRVLKESSVLSPSESCLAKVKCITSQLRKPAVSDGSTSPKTPFSGRSVFVDDASFYLTGNEDYEDLYARLYLAFDNTHDHHLWIATDVLQSLIWRYGVDPAWKNFNCAVSLAALVLGELPSEEAGTLSVLRSVQRCSTHVFNAWLEACNDRMAEGDNWSFAKELYRGVVPGHHIVGPDVVHIKVEKIKDAAKYVSDEVAKLLNRGTLPPHIAILCDYHFSVIRESLEKKNVAYCDIEHQLNGTDAVALDVCENAVSLEWPIVFVVHYSFTAWLHELALGLSRARTKLTVVKVAKFS